jgi:TonB family protein
MNGSMIRLRTVIVLLLLSALAIITSAAAEDVSPTAPPGSSPPRMDRDYPPVSIREGEQGDVGVRYLVKEDGTVGDVTIVTSSGSPRLDEAAISLVKRWRFHPALKDGQPVPAWLSAVVRYRLHDDNAAAGTPANTPPPIPPAVGTTAAANDGIPDAEADPTLTPPKGSNADVIGANDYPMWSNLFRQQGRVILRILVLDTGRIGEASVLSSSGYSALDRATLDIVKARFRYTPAMKEGKPIAVWSKVGVDWRLTDAGSDADVFSGANEPPVPDPLPPDSWRPDPDNSVTAPIPHVPNMGTITVRLRVFVKPDGSVERAQVIGSSGSFRLDAAAMHMVAAHWFFSPPQSSGGWTTTTVTFGRHEGPYPFPLPHLCRDAPRTDAPPPSPPGQLIWPTQFLINEDGSAGASLGWASDTGWGKSTLANDINKEHRFLVPKRNGVPTKCWFDLNIPGVL